jgi:hypothetical protein
MNGTPADGAPRQFFERRKCYTMQELWQENTKALKASGLSSCQMRYVLAGGNLSFFIRFSDQVPSGRLDLSFPLVDRTWLEREGWTRFVLNIEVAEDGRLAVDIRGTYERDGVTLDVHESLDRTTGLGSGIGRDAIELTDLRTDESPETTLREVIDEKMKDGTRKFARREDNLRDLAVEGIVGILTRFLKDAAVRRRVVRKT